MTTRVGVIADTHCPEFMPKLPESVAAALSGASLILHAGDVNGREALDELKVIAPVEAVRGDHDHDLPELPATRELTLEGRRIVIVHGNRSRWIEEPETLLWTLSLGFHQAHQDLPRVLRRRYPEADVIVYGHTHRPRIDIIEGALVFNPGGVHQWNPETATARLRQRPGWFEWCWLQVARHLRRYSKPSVGILEFTESAVVPSIVEL